VFPPLAVITSGVTSFTSPSAKAAIVLSASCMAPGLSVPSAISPSPQRFNILI